MARVAKKIASARITRSSDWRSDETSLTLAQNRTFPPRNILHFAAYLAQRCPKGQSLKTGHNYAYQRGLIRQMRWVVDGPTVAIVPPPEGRGLSDDLSERWS